MKVIVVRIPGRDFELGRVLSVPCGGTIEAESAVSVSGRVFPFFWLEGAAPEPFATEVRNHPSTAHIEALDSFDDRTLFAFEFRAVDRLLQAIADQRGQVLVARGTEEDWCFEIRFPTHHDVTQFQVRCENARIRLVLDCIHDVGNTARENKFGLTNVQLKTILYAVDEGFFDIPRGTTLQEIAEEFGISDQAVSERLRRSVKALTRNALLAESQKSDRVPVEIPVQDNE